MGLARALAVALVIVAAGCGGHEAAGPRGCLRIYFEAAASGRQIDRVRHRLYRDDAVAAVRFVSQQQALAEMRRRHPEMTEDMPFNPLPASFRVTPKSREDGDELVGELRARPAGVDVIRYARRPARCGER